MGDFISFCKSLEKRLELPLPGSNSHKKMASRFRLKELKNDFDKSKAFPGGVLILLYPNGNRIQTVLTRRQTYDGVHSGQISFPGGRKEEPDNSLIETALRESKEEINIEPELVNVLGTLSEMFIPPSNFNVLPVVGYTVDKPFFIPDTNEVAEIIEVNFDLLFDKKLRGDKLIEARGYKIYAPFFNFCGHTVWGATAMILSELIDVVESM